MKKLGLGIGIFLILCIAGAAAWHVFFRNPTVIIRTSDRIEIDRGAPLMMQGEQIGSVRATRLVSSNDREIRVAVTRAYWGFINQSTVFTVETDTRGNSLVCKTCDASGMSIEPGHPFELNNRLEYELACIRQSVSGIWNDRLKGQIIRSLRQTGTVSEAMLDRLRRLAREQHDTFQALLDEIETDIADLDPKIRDELKSLSGE